MDELVQRLDIVPDSRRSQYLPEKVLTRLPIQDVVVFAVDDDASDTAQFSERYGFGALFKQRSQTARSHRAVSCGVTSADRGCESASRPKSRR